MASSSSPSIVPFTHNALQINFDQVLNLDDDCLVSVFNSLTKSGLKEFLGCPPLYHPEALTEFFTTADVTPAGDITCTIKGKQATLKKALFTSTFNLPTSGLVNVLNTPLTSVKEMKKKFSVTQRPVRFTDNKEELKVEFRLLHDIVAKSLLAKAGPCDHLTQEKFYFMVAIFTGEKIDWGTVLFDVLKYIVTQPSRKVKGFAVQVSLVLAKCADDLGPSTSLLSSRILDMKRLLLYKKNNHLDGPQIEKVELVTQKLKKGAVGSGKRKGAAEEDGSAQKKQKKMMIFNKVPQPKQMKGSVTSRVNALIQEGMSLESAKKQAAQEVDDDGAAEQSQRAPTFTQAAPQLTLQLLHRQMDELKTEQHILASELKAFKDSAFLKISDLQDHCQKSIASLADRVGDSERSLSEQIAVLGQQVAELVRLKQVDKEGESSQTQPKKQYESHPRHQPLMHTAAGQGKGRMIQGGGRSSSDPSIADATDQFIEEDLDRMGMDSEKAEQTETRGRTFTLEQLIKLTGSFTAEQIGEFFKVLEHNPSMIFFLRKLYSQ